MIASDRLRSPPIAFDRPSIALRSPSIAFDSRRSPSQARELAKIIEVAGHVVARAEATRGHATKLHGALHGKAAARQERELAVKTAAVGTLQEAAAEGPLRREKVGRRLGAELGKRVDEKHAALETAAAIIGAYQSGQANKKALRDAL